MNIKKLFDLIFAIILLLIFFPAGLLISLIIWFELRENPLFIQHRGIDLNVKSFRIYKFRTLRSDIEDYSKKNIFQKYYLTDRVSKFGRILRRTGLDEIPQLLNVIKGEMSLVGPRPLSIEDLINLKQFNPGLYEIRCNLNLRPGITGLWQLYGDRKKGADNLVQLDELYKKKQSFLFDILLIIKTVPMVFKGTHSDSIIRQNSSADRKTFSPEYN